MYTRMAFLAVNIFFFIFAVTPDAAAGESPEKEPFIYNEYSVFLEYFPETREISGFERVQYKNDTGVPIHKVCFNLSLNAFNGESSKPYFQNNYNSIFKYGEDFGYVNVVNTYVNGNVSRYSLDGTILTVYLPFILQKEQVVTVDIHLEAYVPLISHRTGGNEKAVWFGNFIPVLAVYDKAEQRWRTDPYYPAGKPFYTNISNYTLRVTTPSDYSAIGAGDASVSESGDKKTTTMTAKMVRDFAFAISDSFKEATGLSESGVYVGMYCYSDVPRRNVDYLIDTAEASLDYFTDRIGGYPYKTLKITESGSYLNTMVYPQIIFLNTGCVMSENLSSAALSLAVGVARQWFYGVVGNDQINEAWLSEGLSCYTAYEFIYRDDKEKLAEVMNDLYLGLQNEYEDYAHTRISDSISVYESNRAYNAIQMTKAALMFHSLKNLIGSAVYDEFLRLYYSNNYLSVATAENIINAAETAYGQCLADFFDSWLYEDGLPK